MTNLEQAALAALLVAGFDLEFVRGYAERYKVDESDGEARDDHARGYYEGATINELAIECGDALREHVSWVDEAELSDDGDSSEIARGLLYAALDEIDYAAIAEKLLENVDLTEEE